MWTSLIVLILFLLGFDLFFLHRKGGVVNAKKAAYETAIWITLAISFSFVIHFLYDRGWVNNSLGLSPHDAVIKYITGYLVELSLSVDNLFVIAMIFTAFKIPLAYQHKALFWGILGAMVFRGIMIAVGVVLMESISWMTYVFGALLIYTALRMFLKKEKKPSLNYGPSRFFRFSTELDGSKFWTVENGRRLATPLFAALMLIEVTDLLFALDSIPAILAVTTDPFIVFSSNIFAILGLRAMYFFLANMLEKFHYIKYSVFAILIFVGVKLLLVHYYKFPEWVSLGFIIFSLLTGIVASLVVKRKGKPVSGG